MTTKKCGAKHPTASTACALPAGHGGQHEGSVGKSLYAWTAQAERDDLPGEE